MVNHLSYQDILRNALDGKPIALGDIMGQDVVIDPGDPIDWIAVTGISREYLEQLFTLPDEVIAAVEGEFPTPHTVAVQAATGEMPALENLSLLNQSLDVSSLAFEFEGFSSETETEDVAIGIPSSLLDLQAKLTDLRVPTQVQDDEEEVSVLTQFAAEADDFALLLGLLLNSLQSAGTIARRRDIDPRLLAILIALLMAYLQWLWRILRDLERNFRRRPDEDDDCDITVKDIFENPAILAGKVSAEVSCAFDKTRWLHGEAGETSPGWKFEFMKPGTTSLTGLQVRWSSGLEGRHFRDSEGKGLPYWVITIPNGNPPKLWIDNHGNLYTKPPNYSKGDLISKAQIWPRRSLLPLPGNLHLWVFGSDV